jgi:hypothetical protein
MAALIRRRDPEARQQSWRAFYSDVHLGTISLRSGIPVDKDPWGWTCSFYPGSRPDECTAGTAASFDQARAGFEAAWRVFLSRRTDADFQAWRDQRDWTREKHRRFDRGERMPSDWKPA